MVVKFTLNGVTQKKDIPTDWGGVSFRQFVDLSQAQGDRAKVISILTGLDYELLQKAKIGNMDSLIRLTSFVEREFKYSIPTKLTVLGSNHSYDISNNLELESLERYADLENILKTFDEKDNVGNLNKYPLICATYAVNPYEYKDAEALAPVFFNSPCTEVMAVGNFTQLNMLASKNIIPKIPPGKVSPLSRLRLVMKSWLVDLAFTVRYYSWKRSLTTSDRKYLSGR